MKTILVLAAFLLAALGASAPKPADSTHGQSFVSADPIPLCPHKICPQIK